MLFRAAMPRTVMIPTREPSETTRSLMKFASRAPTSAAGRARKMRAASRQLRKVVCSRRKITIATTPPAMSRFVCAARRSLYSPSRCGW